MPRAMSHSLLVVRFGRCLIIGWVHVFSASHSELIHPFTGLRLAQFRRMVGLAARRGGDAIADGRPGPALVA